MKNKIIIFLQDALPDLKAIYLYGSTGQGEETLESDVDIGVYCSKAQDTVELWKVGQQLAIKLKKDVDLVDLKRASTVMRFQVVSTGERIFSTDVNDSEWWELKIYKLYFQLNDDRKPILEEIKKTGRIYG